MYGQVVDNKCQFRLPTYRFMQGSDAFAAKYGLVEAQERGVDAAPIELDVNIDDFRAFLEVLYPMCVI